MALLDIEVVCGVDIVLGIGMVIDCVIVVQFELVKVHRLSVQIKYEQLPSGSIGQSES